MKKLTMADKLKIIAQMERDNTKRLVEAGLKKAV